MVNKPIRHISGISASNKLNSLLVFIVDSVVIGRSYATKIVRTIEPLETHFDHSLFDLPFQWWI